MPLRQFPGQLLILGRQAVCDPVRYAGRVLDDFTAGVFQAADHVRFFAESQAGTDGRHRRHVRPVHVAGCNPAVRGVNGDPGIAPHDVFKAQAIGGYQQIVRNLSGNQALAGADVERAADPTAGLALHPGARGVGIVVDPCVRPNRNRGARGKDIIAHLAIHGDARTGREHVTGDLAIDDHGLARREQIAVDRCHPRPPSSRLQTGHH